MSRFPRPIQQRAPQTLAGILSRLRLLESRTSCIDSGWPLALLPGTIDPAYVSGDPKVAINGAALTGPYQHLASYTPAANDAVLVAPVGVTRTYIVLGKLT